MYSVHRRTRILCLLWIMLLGYGRTCDVNLPVFTGCQCVISLQYHASLGDEYDVCRASTWCKKNSQVNQTMRAFYSAARYTHCMPLPVHRCRRMVTVYLLKLLGQQKDRGSNLGSAICIGYVCYRINFLGGCGTVKPICAESDNQPVCHSSTFCTRDTQ